MAKDGIGKCVAQCDCVAESSDDLMLLEVCCCLDFSASFASYLVQDDEITVFLQIPDLENFPVCIPIVFENFFPTSSCTGASAKASADSLDIKFSVASRNLS